MSSPRSRLHSRSSRVERAYACAQDAYAAVGVNVDSALRKLARFHLSLHCWQGDDVTGFERLDSELGGGLAVTGHYPGKARTPVELRADLEKAFSLIPGEHRVNLHASYAETGGRRVERNALEPKHFSTWIDWADHHGLGLDFNPTYFAHPKAADGFTLSHPDQGIRRFWIEHGIACRRIGAAMGKALRNTCVTNFWIPDGFKDTPFDRTAPRRRLEESLDEIFKIRLNPAQNLDALEGKLFGLCSESYVVG